MMISAVVHYQLLSTKQAQKNSWSSRAVGQPDGGGGGGGGVLVPLLETTRTGIPTINNSRSSRSFIKEELGRYPERNQGLPSPPPEKERGMETHKSLTLYCRMIESV